MPQNADLVLDQHDEWLPDPVVAKTRYRVSTRTLWRWDRRPEMRFPPAMIINRRKYRSRNQLAAWDAAMAAKSRAAVAS